MKILAIKIVLLLVCSYIIVYLSLTALGKVEGIWGSGRTQSGAIIHWDGEGWVPFGFPRDRGHVVYKIFYPIYYADMKLWHGKR